MNYYDGKEVMLGDEIELGADWTGMVVCYFDKGQFLPGFLESEWGGYLKKGIMVQTNKVGLIHYEKIDDDPDIVLIRRNFSYHLK